MLEFGQVRMLEFGKNFLESCSSQVTMSLVCYPLNNSIELSSGLIRDKKLFIVTRGSQFLPYQ